jgi:hypothetical protein
VSYISERLTPQSANQNTPDDAYERFGFSHISYGEGAYQVQEVFTFHPHLKIVSRHVQVQLSPIFFLHQLKLRFRECQTSISGIGSVFGRTSLFRYGKEGQQDSPNRDPLGPTEHSMPTWQVPCGVVCAFIAIFIMGRWGYRPGVELGAFLLILIACFLILMGYVNGETDDSDDSNNVLPSHNSLQHVKIVPQKPLDIAQLLGYSNYMANVLNTDKQISIVSGLAEGSSIRSIERMTGVHRDAIMQELKELRANADIEAEAS